MAVRITRQHPLNILRLDGKLIASYYGAYDTRNQGDATLERYDLATFLSYQDQTIRVKFTVGVQHHRGGESTTVYECTQERNQ